MEAYNRHLTSDAHSIVIGDEVWLAPGTSDHAAYVLHPTSLVDATVCNVADCGTPPTGYVLSTSPVVGWHAAKAYCEERGMRLATIRTEAGADFGFAPDESLCGGGQVLKGPDWTLEAVATPGHTSNHICFALKEENAFFSGDHIMGWSTTVITPPDGDMTDYMQSLEKVKAGGYDVLWPTHGPPVRDVTAFIDAYIAHRRAREAQVLKAVADGYARIVEMVPVLYADVDPRLHPAAARSVLGHMIDLTRRGLVVTDGEPGIDSAYRPAA